MSFPNPVVWECGHQRGEIGVARGGVGWPRAGILPQRGVGSAREGVPPTMTVAEIKPGMRGVGRTTVKSPGISEFNFEVITLLAGGGGVIPVKHLILYRTFGPLMEQTGGTAAGMSGSPLYLNGTPAGGAQARLPL